MNYVILLLTIFVSTIAQVLLKVGVTKAGGFDQNILSGILKILTSFYLMAGFGLYGVSSYLTLVSLSKFDLGFFAIFTGLGYVFTLCFSYFLFNEVLTITKLTGSALVILGVYLVSR